jgi:type IV secretory pathway TrbD component
MGKEGLIVAWSHESDLVLFNGTLADTLILQVWLIALV